MTNLVIKLGMVLMNAPCDKRSRFLQFARPIFGCQRSYILSHFCCTALLHVAGRTLQVTNCIEQLCGWRSDHPKWQGQVDTHRPWSFWKTTPPLYIDGRIHVRMYMRNFIMVEKNMNHPRDKIGRCKKRRY